MAKFIVAVTGGIASGKSAVTECFSELSVGIADADIAARKIVEAGQPALQEIINSFGSELVINGQLDRAGLRELIFSKPEAKKQLESIMHPRIRQLLMQDCQAASSDYVIVAIPLLAEGGKSHYLWIDRILVVDTPREIQKTRLLRRDNTSNALADKILDAQATRSQRYAIANDIVINMHDLPSLQASVKRLDKHYRQLASASAAKTD